MHKAMRPSNYFFSNFLTYNQAEKIKKEVICVQILLEIHLTEHGRFHFQGRTNFYIPVLVRPSRHMTSKKMSMFNGMHLQGSNVGFVLYVLNICRYTCIT